MAQNTCTECQECHNQEQCPKCGCKDYVSDEYFYEEE